MRKIHVIIKEPGRIPRSVWISDSAQNLQKTVCGKPETVNIAADLMIIYDGESRLHGKPFCCEICKTDFAGTVILAGVKNGEPDSIPVSYGELKKLMPSLWCV